MKKLLFLIISFTLIVKLSAQNDKIYYPPSFINAVQNGTRTFDGTPGEKYWINKSDYKISANIDVEAGILFGSEEVKFYNNSPKPVYTIVLRIYQDFFKKGNARDFQIPPAAVTDGVDITKIIIEGNDTNIVNTKKAVVRGTNLYLSLDQALASGENLKLSIDWNFEIPKIVNLRMGTYDDASFFVGHWYPQIAVMDDVDGWDKVNYEGMLEFYNDFNNYDVEIKMPGNFIVWGTGELLNPKEVLADKYYARYQKAKYSNQIVSIIDSNDIKEKNFTSAADENTWKFKAVNVPDFAFATSDHYLWDMGSLQFNEKESRVLFAAAYKKESADFYEVAEITKKSLLYFSNEMPGVKYPWPSMTIFNGQGGMEFPMMVNDGSAKTRPGMVGVTSHEIAHTYFPFYMGTSERKYAFMDEGWAVMLPFEFQNKEGNYNPITNQVQGYEQLAGTEFDLPLSIPSSAAGIIPYRQMVYRRAGLAYWFLKDALGDDLFKKALKSYISNWKEKHPTPFDFYHTFEKVTGENLDWFIQPWFFQFGAPDLSIGEVIKVRNYYRIHINKIGNIPVPIKIKIYFDDGTEKTHYESCGIWKEKNEAIVEIQSIKNAVKVELGDTDIPDINKTNNKKEL